ncbi:hypothetical protein [Paenibacillus sp. OAS669]|uniref:hypothetical protein n=1 Tax=Paenibacillus sp. OAS669 TaxID=2663821 RepID=UPI00178BED44|nr:hypothetical protein [Paenibacillus sp. OAS669]MBE1444849.1 hypothetical protein [Paenibacillus sp. OAS669]
MLHYWRNSLADAERLNQDLDKLKGKAIQISMEHLIRGIVPARLISNLFIEKSDKDAPLEVDVLLCPIVLHLKTEHGIKKGDYPKYLTPLWIPARINNEGRLKVKKGSFPWVPRDYLYPNMGVIEPVGTLEGLDNFLSAHTFNEENWGAFFKYSTELLNAVTEQSLDKFEHEMYQMSEVTYLIPETIIQGTTKSIIDLYDHLRGQKNFQYCFKTFLSKRSMYRNHYLRNTRG